MRLEDSFDGLEQLIITLFGASAPPVSLRAAGDLQAEDKEQVICSQRKAEVTEERLHTHLNYACLPVCF
ncbi:hypothetical protein Y1Q_0024651 [Alligator mississippiensis]|uniref:Uncharacterized protein n=1 Tax=Alligator mississippiensis TaxID=8496 RepID=A0A151NB91_ALLMI|nr:hypothetical protein Y1Q_0024651 [Alligator mississippiensis]